MTEFAKSRKDNDPDATNSTQNRAKLLYLELAGTRRPNEWQKTFQAASLKQFFCSQHTLTRKLYQRDGDAKVQASLDTKYMTRNNRYAPHRAA